MLGALEAFKVRLRECAGSGLGELFRSKSSPTARTAAAGELRSVVDSRGVCCVLGWCIALGSVSGVRARDLAHSRAADGAQVAALGARAHACPGGCESREAEATTEAANAAGPTPAEPAPLFPEATARSTVKCSTK